MARAVVFAYHDVGARCLPVLLRHGVDVALVVTHRDSPGENIWFANVEKVAIANGKLTYEAALAAVRGCRNPFAHRRLNIGEPVEIDGRTVCGESARCEAGRLGLPEIVVCLRYQRGQIR